jgi:hypothetical protein
MHGAGIRAMGKLMDRMMGAVDCEAPGALDIVREELAAVRPACAWTSGEWPGLDRAWNDIENTSHDIALLSNHLARAYLGAQRDAR